jgi:hypothetical protein
MAYDDLGLEPVEALANDDRIQPTNSTMRDSMPAATVTPEIDGLDERLMRIIRALDR